MYGSLRLGGNNRAQSFSLTGADRFSIPDEAQEFVSAFPVLGSCTPQQGSASVELLFAGEDGRFVSVRRNLLLQPAEDAGDLEASLFHLTDLSVSREGGEMQLKLSAEGEGSLDTNTTIRRVESLKLDEEHCFDRSAYPSMTAVWAETESVWELAKAYHSSPEAIRSMNDALSSGPIFIPTIRD